VASLFDDAAVVEAQKQAGRLVVDDAGLLVGLHGLVARTTRHRIDHAAGAVHTWCALDVMGIPSALAIDATAVTSCPIPSSELDPSPPRAGRCVASHPLDGALAPGQLRHAPETVASAI